MNATLIILRKDLRLYRWGWITALVLAAIEIYLHGTTVGMINNELNSSLGAISGFGQALLPFFLFALVTQKENLVDPEAYWLGRPLPRLRILGAKLVFVTIILGIFSLADSTVLALNGGALRVPFALGGFFPTFAAWLSVVFLGAQTKSLPRLLAFIVFLYLGLLLIGFLTGAIAPLAPFIENLLEKLPLLPADTPTHIVVLIQTIFWCVAGVAILGFYYKTRRKKTAWVVLVLCGIFTTLLTPTDRTASSFDSDTGEEEIQATIVGIEKVGTQSSGEGTSTRYAVVLEIEGSTSSDDQWIQPYAVHLDFEGQKELSEEVSVIRHSQMIRPTHAALQNRIRVDAFFLNPEEAGLDPNASLDINLFADIQTYSSQEVGRIPIRPDEGFADDGNRFIISSFREDSDRARLELSAYLPSMVLEKSAPERYAEPFRGIYSFGLAIPESPEILPFDMAHGGFSFSDSHSANLEIALPHNVFLEACDLVIYRRILIRESSEDFQGEGLSLPKN